MYTNKCEISTVHESVSVDIYECVQSQFVRYKLDVILVR